MRTRTGSLVKKHGKYYLVVSERDPATGKRKRLWMATDKTTQREAETRAAELFAPFAARDTADRLAHIRGQVDAAEAHAAVLEDAQSPGVLIRDAFTVYERHADRPEAGESTLHQYACQWGCLEKWLEKTYPDAKYMKQITPELARAFMAHLDGKKVTPNTYNKYRSFLGMVWRVLAKDARLHDNPWAEIKTRKLNTAHRRALTVDELRSVCGKATGEMRVLLALGIYTGARLGDCCTMTWANVDLGRGEIRYVPRKTARQTDNKTLTVPMHPVLVGILSETPKAERRRYVVPGFAKQYLHTGSAAVSEVVQAYFAECKLETAGESNGKRQKTPVAVGFHSLRHATVSLLRDAGASMAAAMAITGHTSAALLDVYTHAGAETVRAAVAALPAIGGTYTPPPSDADRLAKVRELAEKLTAANWKETRAELLKQSAEK